MQEDKKLQDVLTQRFENFIRDYKDTHGGRYPSSSLLATLVIEEVQEVYGERLAKRLLGPVE